MKKHKLGPKPEWIKPGMAIDFHSMIGGPVTSSNMMVTNGPQEMCGQWVVWLHGKLGCVSVDACTPHHPIMADQEDKNVPKPSSL